MSNETTPEQGVIDASRRLMKFLDRNVGGTADWPVQIIVDNAKDRERLIDLLNNLNMQLELLP